MLGEIQVLLFKNILKISEFSFQPYQLDILERAKSSEVRSLF